MATPQPSPQDQVRKAAAKAIKAQLRTIEAGLGYPATKRHRLRTGPTPPRRVLADQALHSQSLELMRAEARQAYRSFSLARALTGRMADLLVADGFVVEPSTLDQTFNDAAHERWERWCRNCTIKQNGRSFTQVLRSIAMAWMLDGDELVLMVAPNAKREGVLQEIEADRVVNPGGSQTRDTATCMAGVEMDDQGAPWYYYIVSRSDGLSDNYSIALETTPVPAEYAALCTNPLSELVNQTRGEPGLATSVPMLEKIEKYVNDQATAAMIATLFGLVFTTENPGSVASALNTQTGEDQISDDSYPGTAQSVGLQAGFMMNCKPGEKVEQVKPEFPQQSTKEFVQLLVQMCSADVGLPLILVMLDPSAVNFHGFKSALAVTWRRISFGQDVLAGFIRRVYEWKIAEWIASGELTPPQGLMQRDQDGAAVVRLQDVARVHIFGPSIPSPDPGKDTEAAVLALNHNLTTKSAVTQNLGNGSARAIAQARAKERAEEIALGIVPMSMPGAKAIGAEAAAAKSTGDKGTADASVDQNVTK